MFFLIKAGDKQQYVVQSPSEERAKKIADWISSFLKMECTTTLIEKEDYYTTTNKYLEGNTMEEKILEILEEHFNVDEDDYDAMDDLSNLAYKLEKLFEEETKIEIEAMWRERTR